MHSHHQNWIKCLQSTSVLLHWHWLIFHWINLIYIISMLSDKYSIIIQTENTLYFGISFCPTTSSLRLYDKNKNFKKLTFLELFHIFRSIFDPYTHPQIYIYIDKYVLLHLLRFTILRFNYYRDHRLCRWFQSHIIHRNYHFWDSFTPF